MRPARALRAASVVADHLPEAAVLPDEPAYLDLAAEHDGAVVDNNDSLRNGVLMTLLSYLPLKWQPMPHPNRAGPNFLFVDISSNNGPDAFNASAYAKAGHLMIGIKATEGQDYLNPYHARQVTDAHAHRVAVLHYHFITGSGAILEARHFWAAVKPLWRRGDRLAGDFEEPALMKLGASANEYLAVFDHELERLSGVKMIGYTFRSALDDFALRVLSGKWWVASFGSKWPAGAFRRLPGSSTMWAWQFTNGTIGAPGPRGLTGIAGRSDVSVLAPPIVQLLKRELHR